MRTYEEIIAELDKSNPKGFNLVYIDYNDSLNKEQIEDLVRGNMDSLWESNDEWVMDCQSDAAFEICKEELSEEEFEDEDLRFQVQQYIEENDNSDVLEDLARQSSALLYYNTNYEVCGRDTETEAVSRRTVLNALRIKTKGELSKEVIDAIDSCTLNSFYGGMVTILLKGDDLEDLLKLKGDENVLVVKDPVLCIQDRLNGSGDFETLKGITVEIPFDRTQLHSDAGACGYSVQEIFGVGRDCGSDSWEIKNKPRVRKPKLNDSIRIFEENERRFEESWKKGICTRGDSKYSRHGDKEYINEFPCGTHCKKCGQFWID